MVEGAGGPWAGDGIGQLVRHRLRHSRESQLRKRPPYDTYTGRTAVLELRVAQPRIRVRGLLLLTYWCNSHS